MSSDMTMPEGTRREIATERSQRVSRALHEAARRQRIAVRGNNALFQPGFSRAGRSARLFGLVSLLVVFVLPVLLSATYFGLIAADQYQVEVKFAVRGNEKMPSVDGGAGAGMLAGFSSIQQTQDALVVTDFIQSRAMVDRIDHDLDLRSMFSRPEADVVARFDPTASVEDLVEYWRKHVSAGIELPSGNVTVRVKAFRPEDSAAIARAVLGASEDLINEMTTRSRRDALTKARDEVARAEKKLVAVRQDVKALRDKQQLLDPGQSADAASRMLTELRLQKIQLDSEMQVSARNLSAASPQMRILKARLDAVTGQIADLERTLTTRDAKSSGTLSSSFAAFDKARLEQAWAEKYYTTVQAIQEQARVDLERQQVYIDTFVQPVVPQSAEYPRRIWDVFLTAIISLGVWLSIAGIRSMITV